MTMNSILIKQSRIVWNPNPRLPSETNIRLGFASFVTFRGVLIPLRSEGLLMTAAFNKLKDKTSDFSQMSIASTPNYIPDGAMGLLLDFDHDLWEISQRDGRVYYRALPLDHDAIYVRATTHAMEEAWMSAALLSESADEAARLMRKCFAMRDEELRVDSIPTLVEHGRKCIQASLDFRLARLD